jgi:hypothetical protein
MEAVTNVVAICLAGAVLSTGGGRMRTISFMSKKIVVQNILMVGLPMVMVTVARDVKDEVAMATATIACSVGDVAILKTNFMPEQEREGRLTTGGRECKSTQPIWEHNHSNS